MSYEVTERKLDDAMQSSISDSGRTGERTITRVFDVTGPVSARTGEYELAFGVPRRGEVHPQFLFCWCRQVSSRRVSPILTEVTCTYKGSAGEDEAANNPLLQPAEIRFGTITSEEAIDEDVNGNPISTFNGEPIMGVTKPFSDLSIQIKKNIAAFAPLSFYGYIDRVNSDTFLTMPAGTLRIASIAADPVYTEDFAYWTVTVGIQARKPIRSTVDRAWWKRLRHEGYYVIDPDNTDQLVHAAKEGQNVRSPVPIKYNPDDLSDADNGKEETDTEVGHWIEFEIFEQVSFSSMGII